jgi:hypothetical protein
MNPETLTKYEKYTDNPFSESDSSDEFPVVHPKYSCDIADHICRYEDKK